MGPTGGGAGEGTRERVVVRGGPKFDVDV